MPLARFIPSAIRRPSVSDVTANLATARAPDAVTATAMAVVLVSALLIFFSLDNRMLWMDEAETALLGRSILAHGVPTAFDGRTSSPRRWVEGTAPTT